MPLEFLRQGKSRVNASFPTAVRQAPLIVFFVTRSFGVDQEVKTVDVFCNFGGRTINVEVFRAL